MPRNTPTILRWQLGHQMRQLREQAGITLSAAAKEIESSNATMSKIEGGKQAVRPLYVKLLTAMYGVEPALRQELIDLSIEAGKSEWYAALAKSYPEWFRQYLGYESSANRRQVYSVELIDGLLQTADYARAIARVNRPEATERELDRSISLRQGRQERLTDEDPLELHVVMNEAALCRVVGSHEIMRAQVEHVLALAKLPHVTVQVLPFSAGAHPAMTAPFTLLGFDDYPAMNTVYLENGRGGLYLEGEADLERYSWMFDRLRDLALSPAKSRTMLTKVMSQL